MKVRCIALDLDGTTLYDSKTLSEGNRRALEHAIAQGVQVVIASGRVFTSLPDCLTSISGMAYAITSNGAAVYRFPDACIRKVMHDPEHVRRIVELYREYRAKSELVTMETFIDGKVYGEFRYLEDPVAFGAAPGYRDYVLRTRIGVEDMAEFALKHAHELYGLDFIVGEVPLRPVIRERVKAELPEILVTGSVPQRIETAGGQAGKGNALRWLLKELGIPAESCAAFGDADNDIDLLQAAGIGIAVENATEGCKAAANYITKACRKDGVAWAIETILS